MSVLILIRGLPGSGKSTLAEALLNAGTIDNFYEADQYFYDENGKYVFDRTKLSKAHQWCQDAVELEMQEGSIIAVSNTFTQLWEMDAYKRLAGKYNYKLQIITCKGEWENVHNIPKETLIKMSERWED